MLQAQLLEAVPLMKIEDLKPKDITSALKDIHDINNPTPKTDISLTNANQVNNEAPTIIFQRIDNKSNN